jgi:signal transduction histidine kinase
VRTVWPSLPLSLGLLLSGCASPGFDSTGAVYLFVIQPAFTRTLAFTLGCGGAVVLLLWLLFRLRIRALNERARLAAAQRHAERERIARDLHDTLLQGIQALLFRLDRWSREDAVPERLREEIAAVAEQSRTIIIDGRDRIVMLRRHKGEPSEIVQALDHFTRQSGLQGNAALDLRRHGAARPILPHAYEHILDIVREAIRNACAHAQATRIEVDVRYCQKSLQVEIKDNGRGIPADILSRRHERHFGIAGMYERAVELSAQLTHETTDGTRVVLCIHGSHAYADYQRGMLESAQSLLACLRQCLSSGHPHGG